MAPKNILKKREINKVFQAAIKKETGKKARYPDKVTIPFRNEMATNSPRDIEDIPIGLIRLRKNNGRIATEVTTWEKENWPIDENSVEGQDKLLEFLSNKDRSINITLKKSIEKFGQKDEAIITCDGFLINGNRRRKALEILYETTSEEKYKYMKVVFLPSGDNDDFGRGEKPTLIEIQQIEYACQVQATGKSDYSRINTALLYKKNEEMGFGLEAQLKNDPQYSHLPEKLFDKEVERINKEYLLPLEEVDAYLNYFERAEQYTSVSQQAGHDEGRWEAFFDWTKVYRTRLKYVNKLSQLGLTKSQVPKIKKIAIKIMRKKE